MDAPTYSLSLVAIIVRSIYIHYIHTRAFYTFYISTVNTYRFYLCYYVATGHILAYVESTYASPRRLPSNAEQFSRDLYVS